MRVLGKATTAAITVLILAGTPMLSYAQAIKQPRPAATQPKVSAPQPFDLTLGKSTMEESQGAWKREGAKITGEGYGDAKPSYSDNDPDGIANKRIILVDVQDLPLERLETARFGFFDNALYLVRYQFQSGADFDKLFLQVSSKYGPPQRKGGFSDEFFEWKFESVVLSLEKKFMDQHSMTFIHEPSLRGAKASNAEVYASHIKAKAQKQKGF